MALSNTAILNAKATDKAYKLYDSDGLFMQVTPSGGKWWRLKFRFDQIFASNHVVYGMEG